MMAMVMRSVFVSAVFGVVIGITLAVLAYIGSV